MAVLQKIRNKAGLLIGVIAVALLLFLVGDFLQNGTFGRPDRVIAKINGKDIAIDEYQSLTNELKEVYKINSGQTALDQASIEQAQDQAWETLIKDHILEAEYTATGLTVHKDEIFDMVQGENIHPLIRQLFANPQTGQADKSQILGFLKSFDLEGGAERKAYWLFIEKELKRQRLNEKYNTLLSKGILVNTEEADYTVEGTKNNKNIDFFSIAYSTVSDSAITVSPSEISAYYKANKAKYKQTESRNIQYVTYPITASSDDESEVSKWSKEIAQEITEVNDEKELIRYVKFNSDNAWEQKYQIKDDVEDQLQEFAFNNEIGDVYGPYKEDETYKIVKLANREMRSDSVMASHILLKEATLSRTEELADSLMEVLEADKSKMAELAEKFSKDQGSSNKGGELGWFKDGMMVKSFNDAAFEGKVGEVQKIKTQFGTHIIIVTKKSQPVEKVLLATVERKVEASNATHRNIYSEASKFRAGCTDQSAFKTTASENNLHIRFGSNITSESKTVMGLEDSKELVRWAYKAELGDISEVIELSDKFVIATLTKVAEKGYRPQEEVANMIKSTLIKEKKAQTIIDKINSYKSDSKTITSLANKMGTTIKTASDINFNSYSIPQAGTEPNLVGAISVTGVDAISEPIEGNRGVYVFKVTEETDNPNAQTIASTKSSIEQSKAYMVYYQAFNALEELANVEDYKIQYY